MIVRDSLVHEVDVCRWLFGEEIVEITVHSPLATSRAAEGVVDPQIAVFRMAGGGMATTEVFVKCAVGYEVRCEATAELGNATVGLGSGVFVRSNNRWGGEVPDDFRVRFGAAYDGEVQAWVDATRRGEVTGPTTWDGYAATVVCEAGMESLKTGEPGEGGAVMKLALDPYMFRDVPLLELPGAGRRARLRVDRALAARGLHAVLQPPPRRRRHRAEVQEGARVRGRGGLVDAAALQVERARTRRTGRPRCATGSGPSRSPPSWAWTR